MITFRMSSTVPVNSSGLFGTKLLKSHLLQLCLLKFCHAGQHISNSGNYKLPLENTFFLWLCVHLDQRCHLSDTRKNDSDLPKKSLGALQINLPVVKIDKFGCKHTKKYKNIAISQITKIN